MSRISKIVGLMLCLSVACNAELPDPPPTPPSQIAGFDGYYHDGRLDLVWRDPQGSVVQYATDTTLGTQSSGPAGPTTPSFAAVLLHQLPGRAVDGPCNASPYGEAGIPSPFQGVCVQIQAINGYVHYILNEYVQITSLAPCGTTTSVVTYVKDASSATIGVDNSMGLWSYGSVVYPAGDAMGRDRSTRGWYFATNTPGALACFRFSAVVMGQVWSP